MSATNAFASAIAPVVVQSFTPNFDPLAQHEISPDVQLAGVMERDRMKQGLTPLAWIIGGLIGAGVAYEMFRGRKAKAP